MPPPTSESIAWLNGQFLPLRDAALSVLDAGVTSGASVTERLRTFRHRPFLVTEHVTRLLASAAGADVPLTQSAAELEMLIEEITTLNAALVPAADDLTISVFATAGTSSGPTLCLHATPLPAEQYAPVYAGLRLIVPPTRALPANVLSPQIKTRSRLHWHIANAQAAAVDPGATALLIDSDGLITETSAGNLFIVRGGRLLTPDRRRTLHGISQAYVKQLAAEVGLETLEADLRPSDIEDADETFLSSSVSCLLPVLRINQTSIGNNRPGLIYGQLLAAWSAAVGVDIAMQMVRMAAEQRRSEPN